VLKIYKKQGNSYGPPVTIRPTPFVSISHTPQKNSMGSLGCTYNISLIGTIIAHLGSPKLENASAVFDDNHPQVSVETGDLLKSIVLKQNKIKELFAGDGNKIEIGSGNNTIIIIPNFVDINFEEGPYIDICKYTISLESSVLFKPNGSVYTEGLIGLTFAPNRYDENRNFEEYLRETQDQNTRSITEVIQRWGGFVEDFSDTWSLEIDESNGQTFDPIGFSHTYILTRNMSAVGKMIFDINGTKKEAWEQAFGFIKKSLLHEPLGPPNGNDYDLQDNEKYKQYPGYFPPKQYAYDFLNIPEEYKGFNHIRSIDIDKTGGGCSIVDTWVLAKGQSHLENYTISIDRAIDDGFINAKIDGNIRGLSELHAREYNETASSFDFENMPYTKALNKYNQISNNGNFGLGSLAYTRVSNVINAFLNPKPLSVSVGSNEKDGEITYNITFDNRPCTFFNGVLYENISVSDNYPGDVFAVIPVIGRQTGPVLQYIKGRTEYNRNVNVELLLDYEELARSNIIDGLPPSGVHNIRTNLALNKPSLNFPFRPALENLISELSPANEPFVIRYFLKPPTETWQPLEGRYTLSLSWDYEKVI
jgi:hypothetical protein